jgi:hypothetical protein
VVAQQVVDLAEHHLGLRAPRGVSQAPVPLDGLRNEQASLGRVPEVAGDMTEQTHRGRLIARIARLLERAPRRLRQRARLLFDFLRASWRRVPAAG